MSTVIYRKKNRKYGNVISYTDTGERFDSKFEFRRWNELKLLERLGEIKELQRQIVFILTANGVDICKYVADFVYLKDGIKVVEDAKGVRTPEFNLKAKLFEAQYGFKIKLTFQKARA